MAVIPWAEERGLLSKVFGWLHANATPITMVALLGLLVPAFVAYWLVVGPFTVLFVFRYMMLLALMWVAFRWSLRDSPWYVRLIMAMILGQVILNYGFTNIVVGAGGLKFTLAELGVLIGVTLLLPKTLPVLRQMPIFWVCLAAMTLPLVSHLYFDLRTYGKAALRDVLSVVDLIYFLAGLAVCAYGLMTGRWLMWRQRFLTIWIIVGALYGALAPVSPYILAVSPSFQSYQQTVPAVGFMLTAPYNAVAAVAAWYAIPHVFPKARWLRYPFAAVLMLGTLAAVAMAQSRNLYGIFMVLPVVLAFFGYRKAFTATFAGVVILIAGLGLMETLSIKIPGRISDVTLSAFVDRVLSVSGKHGDASGAHGVQQRMDWWTSSLNKWQATPETIAFGVGYGMPLTNFRAPGGDYNEGVVVREPHNSFVSSLSRGGVAYLLLWTYIVMAPMVMAAKGARAARDKEANGGYQGVAVWMFIMMGMLLMSAVSEPVFETPSVAAMYYFVAGIAAVEYMTISGRLRIPLRRP